MSDLLRNSGTLASTLLNQADECFDRVELESSWSSGPEAFSSREYVTQSHVPLLSTQVVLSILAEGNTNPNELVRTMMWEWVQKAKGQSLASTRQIPLPWSTV